MAYVLFKPVTPVPSGSAKVPFSGGRPDISNVIPTGNNVNAIKVSTTSGAGEYFISMFPGTISGGFEMEAYDASDNLLGTAKSTKDLQLERNMILDLGVLDGHIVTPEQTGGTKSGLYLGITGFNDSISNYPIGILNPETKAFFDSFIDGLTMRNGTILYYSVNNAIDRLKAATCPADLNDVALITFTDGLDRGTPMMVDNYPGNESYLNAIHNRIIGDKVSGLPIAAWAIGFPGTDVTDYNQFDKNLANISSSSAYAKRVGSMSEVYNSFQEIAEHLSETHYIQTVTVEMPGEDGGTRVRFVLDGATSATASRKYIEGIFNLNTRSLTDITYVGITCTSGSTVRGSVNGIMVSFTFENISNEDGILIKQEGIKEYLYQNNKWVPNSEFVQEQVPLSYKVKRSAIILLNLDCSTSLANDFTGLKSAAKNFIRILCEASVDKDAVTSVSLSKTSLTLMVGSSHQLIATVSPSTALDKSVLWSSTNPSVATVDSNGKVTAVGPGKTAITVTTVDGAKTATCEVTVKNQLAKSITLDRTEVEMYVGDEPITLVATILPENTSDKSVTWTSSNSSVATVDTDGKVTAVSKGSTKITVRATDGSNVSAACMVTVRTIRTDTNGREYVDLGLPSGLKWATMNVGAAKPEEYGAWFAWGETESKSDYSWSTYKWCNGSENTQTKYNTSSSYGTVDNKTMLDPEDDTAHVNWGGSWRMPTAEERDELINKCTWTWTTQNGVKGRLVTGPNGKSIFLPAAGYRDGTRLVNAGFIGYCWSSSLYTDFPYYACYVHFHSGGVYGSYGSRYRGQSVRPVTE